MPTGRPSRSTIRPLGIVVVSSERGSGGTSSRGFSLQPFRRNQLNAVLVITRRVYASAFAESRFGVLAVTERDGQIYLHRIDPLTLDLSQTSCPPGGDKRRHPVVAANSKGEVLLAWTEGTAWEKGGALLWQLFDKSGKTIAEKGRAEDVPIWSLPTAFASADGNFAILY